MLLINKAVNLQKRKDKSPLKRIWLEGKRLARHVKIGTGMQITDTDTGIKVVFSNENPDRTVSKRKSRGSEVPLIEINESNSKFLSEISEDAVLRIAINDKGISVCINQETVDLRIKEREERTLKNLADGKPLEVGSAFAGGGTFDYMGHKGFEKSGLATVVRLAIDFEESAVENLAANVGHVFDDKSILIESDISLLKFGANTPKLDILKITPPCVDACSAGKAKKGNKVETSKTAHLVYYYSQLLDKSNPSYVLLENVPEFQSEASFLVLQALLNNWGYKTQIRVIEANKEGFALETRKRMFLVAESEGLAGTFDIEAVTSLQEVPKQLAEIMDPFESIPEKSWSPKTGLIEKEKRDIEDGKGFRMQIFNGTESYIGTLRAQYQKSGSSDPLFSHPDEDKKLFRIANKNEHARIKQIDEALVEGLTEGEGHTILGNGLIGSIAEAICYHLGKAIKQLSFVDMTQKAVAA